MNKKIIVLSLMLCSAETKPFGIVEILALIGFGAIVKTKPVQMAVKSAWSRYLQQAQGQTAQIPPMGGVRELSKIDQNSTFKFKTCVRVAREAVLQGARNLAPALAVFQAKSKQLLQDATKKSEMTINLQASYHSSAYQQPYSRTNVQNGDTAVSAQITQINATQQINQASGLFPRVTNNYYSGKAEEVVEEMGKKRFWQGAFFGTAATAWLLKPSAESKKEKKSNE